MYFNIIASGSKGNATLIAYKDSLLLLDMGITLTRLNEGLKEINKTMDDINGAIFTHDHKDHIGGIKFLSPKIMYGLKGTLPPLANVISLHEEFCIKDFKIIPFLTSHDATNPCGFVIKAGDETLVYMTDTGIFVDSELPYLKNPDYLIIESNHDVKMLMMSKRTMELKNRILSDKGHLCNEDSAFAAVSIIGPKTKEIVLAHLSEECNKEELALKAYEKVFSFKGIDIKQYHVHCAKQRESVQGGHHED